MELWGSPHLSQLNPKVIELLIATVRHFYSNEKLIESKLAEFIKSDPSMAKVAAKSTAGSSAENETPSSSGADPVAPPPPPPPPTHPNVDPDYLQQLCDMGFQREHAEEALIVCANDLASAMDWILNHPAPPATMVTYTEHAQ